MDGTNQAFIPVGKKEDDMFDELFIIMTTLEETKLEENTKMPERTLPLHGAVYITYMLNGHPGPRYEMFHMEPLEFITLCCELRICGHTWDVTVEEAIAIFVLIVGHCQGQRVESDRFQHSTETINRHFKTVMRALQRLGKTYIRVRHRNGVHPHLQGNPKYYPWFKVCVTF
jgi:hypothetical protein